VPANDRLLKSSGGCPWAQRNENNGRRLIDEAIFNERRKVEPLIGNRPAFDVNIGGMERRS
jgi:hypothetical protein